MVVYFFLEVYFSNILASQFGIPCSKIRKKKKFQYSHVTYQKTRIGTLNSNNESILENVEKFPIDTQKYVHFGKFPNFSHFLLHVQSIFNIYKKNMIRYLCFVS